MYLIAALAIVIAVISPFAGLIFIIAVGGKYQLEKLNPGFYLVMLIPLLVFMVTGLTDLISGLDLLFGIIIASLVFFRVLRLSGQYAETLLVLIVFNLVYAALRHLLFSSQIEEMIRLGIEQYQQLLSSDAEGGNAALTSQFLELFRALMTKYYIGLWVFSMGIAGYAGAVLFARKSQISWAHKQVRFPYQLVYPVILALVLFIFPGSRILSGNLLLSIAPLFLVQGFSILDFFWGKYFTKSRILLYLLIAALIMNPYLLLLLGLVGLFDSWFDFRKIKKNYSEENR